MMSVPQKSPPHEAGGPPQSASLPRTRCCLLTGAGRSAVAVVAVRGPDASRAVSRCFRAASRGELRPGEVRYGFWVGQSESGIPAESVVVSPIAADSVEIHCHGGTAATMRLVTDLGSCGVSSVEPSDWSRSESGLLISEAAAVVSRCLTSRTAAIAMDQMRGAMLGWATNRREAMMRGDDSLDAMRSDAAAILRGAPLGLRLADPFRIVLIGPPNVGKSSLVNAIVGYDRSITYDGAGTTRDVLHAETVIDGWPVRVSDTAGIRESSHEVERAGVERARAAADLADLVLCVTEPACVGSEKGSMQFDVDPPIAARLPVVRILNKSDLWHPFFAKLIHPGTEAADSGAARDSGAAGDSDDALTRLGYDLLTNALTGEGVKELLSTITGRLAAFIPDAGAPVPVTQRQADRLQDVVMAATRQQIVEALGMLIGDEPKRRD